MEFRNEAYYPQGQATPAMTVTPGLQARNAAEEKIGTSASPHNVPAVSASVSLDSMMSCVLGSALLEGGRQRM